MSVRIYLFTYKQMQSPCQESIVIVCVFLHHRLENDCMLSLIYSICSLSLIHKYMHAIRQYKILVDWVINYLVDVCIYSIYLLVITVNRIIYFDYSRICSTFLWPLKFMPSMFRFFLFHCMSINSLISIISFLWV